MRDTLVNRINYIEIVRQNFMGIYYGNTCNIIVPFIRKNSKTTNETPCKDDLFRNFFLSPFPQLRICQCTVSKYEMRLYYDIPRNA